MHWTKNIKDPDKKYGIVLFYWWCGEELTKEKLSAQIDEIKKYAVAAVQINYCHSYEGGNSYGLTYPSSPALFSDEWWELLDWFTAECGKYGIKVSLSDYTLSGVGQGYYTDRILADHPEYRGKRLCAAKDGGGELTVAVETVYASVSPIKPGIGKLVCEYFFEEFEKRTHGKLKEDFDFFFSDELGFGIDGYLWDEELEDEFKAQKGYDIKDHYRELFICEGDYVKTRTDYYDVTVALMNRHYFSVIYDFHESRGMTYGCDHGSRGLDPIEFGSYFSTQKYNQGPGCDQPMLGSDIIKNKVAASIANVNRRPRVWLEGFYGSGWGTSTEMLTDAICRNYAMGHNLTALHGTYYTTLGGFWEWAPPCNLIRMPYRDAMKELLDAVKRMSYIMSRGYRYTKVAIHYPTASLQCGCGGGDVKEAFGTAEYLYKDGIDFDFVDDEALLGAQIVPNGVKIGENTYEYLIFPKSGVMRAAVRDLIDRIKFTDATVFFGEDKKIIRDALRERCPDVTVFSRCGDVYVSHRVFGDDHIYMIYGAAAGARIDVAGAGYLYGVDLMSGELYPLENVSECGGSSVICPQTELPVFVMIRASEPLDEAAETRGFEEPQTVAELDLFDVEYESVLNNKYGDFSLPAFDGQLPLEVRTFGYVENDGSLPLKTEREVTYGVGPYYKFAVSHGEEETEALIADAVEPIPSMFRDYEISLRYGVPGDPGVQGYHGLKGIITDDFLVMGAKSDSQLGFDYVDDGRAATLFTFDVYYSGENAMAAYGAIKPCRLLVNGKETSCADLAGALVYGKNRIVAVYNEIGRTHLYLYDADAPEKEYPLSMSIYKRKSIVPIAQSTSSHRWLRFGGAPGIEGLVIDSVDSPDVFVDGVPVKTEKNGEAYVCEFDTKPHGAEICLRFEAKNAVGGGAVLRAPIIERCSRGKAASGDLSLCDGLKAYSGAVRYSARVTVERDPDLRYYVETDRVVSAMRVSLNGSEAGTVFCAPWRVDVTELIRSGENELLLTVYGTLANNYYTVPTKYRGRLEYGIMSPVRIIKAKG